MEENKKELRKLLSDKRSSTSLSEKNKYDNMIFDLLSSSSFYKKSNIIFTYVSFKNEVNTHNIIEYSLSVGKIVCVPYIISKENGMKAVQIKSMNDLKIGKYNILEPKNSEISIEPKNIDLVIVPGLGFDSLGGRLGFGGGYYDRFMKKIGNKALKYGLAYSFQIVDKVPVDIWDVNLNGVVTENKIITVKK